MSFEPAGNYLIKAARQFGFHQQVGAGVILEQTRHFFEKKYKAQSQGWNPKKFKDKVLYIQTTNSGSASALFLYQNQIMEEFASHKLLKIVKEIQIERS